MVRLTHSTFPYLTSLIIAEMAQCRREGIPLQFKLQLPPAAQAIVNQVDRESARMSEISFGRNI